MMEYEPSDNIVHFIFIKALKQVGAAADISLVKFWEKAERRFSRVTSVGGRPAGCKDIYNAVGIALCKLKIM